MILQRLRRLVGAAVLVLAPSVGLAQSTLQQPNLVASPGVTVDPLPSALTKLYQNDLFLQGLIAARISNLGGAAQLNVGTTAGTVADGGALTAEIARATAAEQANASGVSVNSTAIAFETSRAQTAEALKAPIASPAFTGIPTVPTAANGTATMQAASTAYVVNTLAAAGVSGAATVPATRQVLTSGLATGGGDLSADRTIIVPKAAQSDVAAGTDDAKALTSFSVAAALGAKAPLASPALVGTPTAPTAAAGTNTTQIATTAFATSTAAAAVSAIPVVPIGQARLSYSSATALLLKGFQGNQIWVNGAFRTIPAGGVSLANTGLTAATLYYVYAYMNGSTLTLEAVTTGHTADATYGHEIKSGDGTRTYIGMVYMAGSSGTGTFADSPSQRWVASWFNRPPRPLLGSANPGSTSSTTPVEANSASRVQFIAHADEEIDLETGGVMSNSGASQGEWVYAGLDGAALGPGNYYQDASAGTPGPAAARATTLTTEGAHYATVMFKAGGGTASVTAAVVGVIR